MFVVTILLAVAIMLYTVKRARTYGDIAVPVVSTKRSDLYFGYYGCLANQVAETKDHTNLLHESQFEGIVKAVQNIIAAEMDTSLDISQQLFEKGIVKETAALELRNLFGTLKAAGVLSRIKFLYPQDEPNNTTTIDQLKLAIGITKNVVSEFPELNGVRYAVIYAADKPFIGQDMFDFIGFDDYDKKSSVLVGQYVALKKTLLPHQKTIIVPGGAYGQDPTPFVNFAQANPEVGMVLAFLWFDDTGGSVGAPGIRSQPLQNAAYRKAGAEIK